MFFSFSVINSYFCTCHFRIIVFLYVLKIEIISPVFTIYIISLLNQSVCQHIHICSICIYLTDFYFSSLSFFIPFFLSFFLFIILSFFLSLFPYLLPSISVRLILGCERIRKLLSQLPESSITVENMSDNGDVNFSLKRDELSLMCADLLNGFKALIRQALLAAGVTSTGRSLLL